MFFRPIFQTTDRCPGEAQAAQCEDVGGTRISLLDHMKRLWELVDFRPVDFELDADESELETNFGGYVQICNKTVLAQLSKDLFQRKTTSRSTQVL